MSDESADPRPDGRPAFEHRFEVRLHDTDAAGVLFFAHLFRHAHDAYESFMGVLGHPLHGLIEGTAGQPPIRLPIVHAQAEYRAPLRLGERIRVQLRVAEIRRRSFAIDYVFMDECETVRATARTVHCLIPSADGAEPSLPEPLASALARA